MSHPASYYQDPALRGLLVYGPNANCTLALCSPLFGIYHYRPSISANAVFLAFFAIALIIHLGLGIKWRTWFYTVAIVWGCIAEILGYGGRIMLWKNPFTFTGFLMQIICITIGPTFFTAAIYVTLSKIVLYLGPQYARFSPKLYYWIFIPCDILSLVLQSIGGARSSTSSGSSNVAVAISIAGLSFQVITLVVFIALAIDYALCYLRGQKTRPRKTPLGTGFKVFVGSLSAAIILILIRCAYRIDELSDGYHGPLIHNEGLFIGLEGVMILVSVFVLMVSHPGPVFARADAEMDMENVAGEPKY